MNPDQASVVDNAIRGKRASTVCTWLLVAASLCNVRCSSDSGAAPGAGAPMTADQWCDQGPAQICAARKPCCQSGNVGWDQAQCESTEKQACSTHAASVQSGKRGFDAAAAKSCVAATQTAASQCSLAPADYALLLSVKQSCAAIFPGALAAASSCDSSADCKAEAGNIGLCDASQKCSVRALTHEGDACVGSPAACDTGQFCDTWTTPGTSTCRALVPAGQPCPHGLECEPTAYCDLTTHVCTSPLEAGKPCLSNTQCASFLCDFNNQCGPVGPFLGKKECGIP